MPKTILSTEQMEFIKANRLLMSGSSMAKRFGVDKGVVNRYLNKTGLSVPRELSRKWAAQSMQRPFTTEEDNHIISLLPSSSIKQIARDLKRTSAYVGKRARQLGLGDIIETNKINSQIKPGTPAPNKGRKQEDYMTKEAIERTKKRRFQKGGVPGNTKYDGAIVTRHSSRARGGRPYKMIRIAMGKWQELQRYNWEQVYGTIEKGMCLWCRSDDTLNCDPDNWELITRAENVKRNSGSKNLQDGYIAKLLVGKYADEDARQEYLKNAELIELKRQQIILNRNINEQRKRQQLG